MVTLSILPYLLILGSPTPPDWFSFSCASVLLGRLRVHRHFNLILYFTVQTISNSKKCFKHRTKTMVFKPFEDRLCHPSWTLVCFYQEHSCRTYSHSNQEVSSDFWLTSSRGPYSSLTSHSEDSAEDPALPLARVSLLFVHQEQLLVVPWMLCSWLGMKIIAHAVLSQCRSVPVGSFF